MIGVILLAGGKGRRMGLSTPKQYLDLGGKPVVQHALDLFLSTIAVDEIALVCDPKRRSLFEPLGLHFALPGTSRQESVRAGLAALPPDVEWVIIHDAVRPLASPNEVEEVVYAMKEHGAATVATPVRYSVKEIDADGFVAGTIDRSRVWEIQTPQGMRRDWLAQGFARASIEGWEVTDEATLIERLGHPVKVVQGGARNLKITTIEDLLLARQLVES